MRKLLGTGLRNRELAFFKVAKEVTTVELLHNDINIVLILEYIKQTNNMRVLAHLENLDFSSLQLDILHRHLLL